jgi:hypothetical protein
MKRLFSVASLALLVGISVLGAASAGANDRNRPEIFRAWLVGFEEVGPNIAAVSSPAHGFLRAIVDEDEGTIQYWLTFDGFVNTVAQSHFHFGQHHTAGGISVFLCTNLGNAPVGITVQACPQSGQITGTIHSTDVIGPAGQGIAAGEFAELVAAMRAGTVYVNIHTNVFPSGEIRGQLVR